MDMDRSCSTLTCDSRRRVRRDAQIYRSARAELEMREDLAVWERADEEVLGISVLCAKSSSIQGQSSKCDYQAAHDGAPEFDEESRSWRARRVQLLWKRRPHESAIAVRKTRGGDTRFQIQILILTAVSLIRLSARGIAATWKARSSLANNEDVGLMKVKMAAAGITQITGSWRARELPRGAKLMRGPGERWRKERGQRRRRLS